MIETLLLYNAIAMLAIGLSIVISRCEDGIGEKLLRWGLFFILWIPAACRWGIGTDWESYVTLFYAPEGQIQHLEPAYALLNIGLEALGARAEVMLAVVAAITYLPISHGVPKRWLVPVVAVFVLTMYLSTYSLVRQSVAISIVLMMVTQLEEDGRVDKALGWIAFACLWHFSAVVVLPLLMIRRVKINGWIALALIPVLWYMSKHGFIQSLFSSDLFLSTKYGAYASNRFNRGTQIGSGLGIALRMFIPLLFMIQLSGKERKDDLILYSVLAYVFAYMLSVQVHIFNRLADVFSYAPIAAFGSMYTQWKRKLWLWGLIIVLAVNFQKTIVDNTSDKHGGLGIAPYENIFEHK